MAIASSQRPGRRRYVIDRTLERVSRFRCPQRRYERIATHCRAFAQLARAVVRHRRRVRLNLLTTNNPE